MGYYELARLIRGAHFTGMAGCSNTGVGVKKDWLGPGTGTCMVGAAWQE